MTIKELSKLYDLNREVEALQKRLAGIEWEIQLDEERLRSLEAQCGAIASPGYDGMPHGSSGGNKLESEAIELVDLRNAIARKKALRSECAMTIHAQEILCLTERNRLERYIASVPDSLTRQIMALRFINGLSWWQVAYSIGGNNTGDSVRMNVKRYLQSEKEDGE
jgi:hypothetical protein